MRRIQFVVLRLLFLTLFVLIWRWISREFLGSLLLMTHEEAFAAVDSAIWEMGEAFGGLPDADIWVRAHPRLLSVGELASHVGCAFGNYFLEEFESPLRAESTRYYPHSVDDPLVLDMGSEAVYGEVKRLYELAKARFLADRPDLSATSTVRDDWTWGYLVEYMAFHTAYHTGQMYSVRHMMGHETPDN